MLKGVATSREGTREGLAEGQSALVYDFGAGTFDASVVRRGPAGAVDVDGVLRTRGRQTHRAEHLAPALHRGRDEDQVADRRRLPCRCIPTWWRQPSGATATASTVEIVM